jgi:invasion protein IalB
MCPMTIRVAVLLALGLLATPALAQQRAPAQAAPAIPEPPPPAPGRAWNVACADEPVAPPRNCRLATAIMAQPQNQRIAQVVMMRQPQTRSLSLVFQLPHGAMIPAGMSWQVDETTLQRLPFQNSDPNGLYSGMPVTDDLLAALRRGATLKIGFTVAANRQQITIPVPLAQFDSAVAEFLATEQRAP